jgi:septum formation protein
MTPSPHPRAPSATDRVASRPALVLASGSPRRRDLLTQAALPFQVIPAALDEALLPGEEPEHLVERLARAKAGAVAERLAPVAHLVLGADTVVAIDDEVLGKPENAAHAERLLLRLLGRTHRVLTGVAVVEAATGRVQSRVVASHVTMRDASAAEVARYVASGEPLDKAGAYALQGTGRNFVLRVEGSESNVIGLPLDETLALLESAGWMRSS